MRKFHLFVHALLLITTPAALLQAEGNVPRFVDYFCDPDRDPEELFKIATYDDFLAYFDLLETEEYWNTLSEREAEEVIAFMIFFGRLGVMPGHEEEMERDILELLNGRPESEEFIFWAGAGDFIVVPGYQQKHYKIAQRGWLAKQWKRGKKWLRNHKKELLIAAGAAAGITLAGFVAAAVLGGSAGAVALASEGDKPHKPKKSDPQALPQGVSVHDAAMLQAAVEKQIASYKESVLTGNANPFQPPGLPWGDCGRSQSSLLAQDVLKTLRDKISTTPSLRQQLTEQQWHYASLQAKAPHKIDTFFSTDYALAYDLIHKEGDLRALTHQIQGEQALNRGELSQAAHEFDRAIALNPSDPLSYLDRGLTHFQSGNYEQAVEDYQHFVVQSPPSIPLSIPEFSIGFAKGLPQGLHDSGKGLLTLVSACMTHPIDTAQEVYHGVTQLIALARSQEYETICQALSPEAHQLVKEWDSLSSHQRGELAGYVFGKCGGDLFLPGAIAKVASMNVRSAQELLAVAKRLQTAEKVMVMESLTSLEKSTQIAEALQANQKTLALGEELGLTTGKEWWRLSEHTKKELTALSGQFMAENEARNLLQKHGIPIFAKPSGVPESYRITLTKKPGGMKYIHPKNRETYVRVMAGNPNSPFPAQRKPYVNHRIDGKSLDKFGNFVSNKSPEAHIPIREFVYREKL